MHDDDAAAPRSVATGWLVAAGLVAGLVVGLTTAVLWPSDTDGDRAVPPSAPTTVALDQDRDLAAAFLVAWHRWRTQELRVDYEFVRERADGEQLRAATTIVQRDGDEVTAGLGGAHGVVDDVAHRCRTEADGTFRCFEDPLETTAAERLELELDRWATQLAGEPPFYRILAGDAGCYDLVLTRALPATDFGREATLCFDDASGALRQTRSTWENGLTETRTAVRIATTVTDADFDGLLAGALD